MQQKQCSEGNLRQSLRILEKKTDLKISNLSLHLRKPEKQQITPKVGRRKDTITGEEISETENRKSTEKINKPKSGFEKINKTDKLLAKQTKGKEGTND